MLALRLSFNRTCLLLLIVALFILALFAYIGDADAATPTTAYTHLRVTWLAPTTGCTNPPPIACDNVSLDEPVTDYQLWIDTQPIPDSPTAAPTAVIPAGTLVYNSYPSFPYGSTVYMRLRARNGTDAAHTGALTQTLTVQAGQIAVVVAKAPAPPGAPTFTISFTTTPPGS